MPPGFTGTAFRSSCPVSNTSALPVVPYSSAGSLLRAAEVNLPKTIDISYKKFVLKNGLTLIVHEDHKAPIVAVNVFSGFASSV